jgi:hypothetical protein
MNLFLTATKKRGARERGDSRFKRVAVIVENIKSKSF